ncbi:hypothetical protein FEM03_21310 [Phragmitibacter flavus]|uniref:Uncharacterized protein n=2 Tax=Phragmitibacter flavus TaxID=2576071 RepID=A0A5R8K8T2_9BACT|nr:hypothetical protein FEM03_21310 [Phragmitibacter flavus]
MLKKISLRSFSIAAQADPGNISRIERGLLPPPHDRAILERYATALGLIEGDDAWLRFFDHAAADRGKIPSDLMNEDSIVKFLPAFFRTLRGKKPTDEEMQAIIEKIQNS